MAILKRGVKLRMLSRVKCGWVKGNEKGSNFNSNRRIRFWLSHPTSVLLGLFGTRSVRNFHSFPFSRSD